MSSGIKAERDLTDGGWVAHVIDHPTIMSQGETEAEAIANCGLAWDEVNAELRAQAEHQRAEQWELAEYSIEQLDLALQHLGHRAFEVFQLKVMKMLVKHAEGWE